MKYLMRFIKKNVPAKKTITVIINRFDGAAALL